jgi:hypothetical protein
MPTTVRGDFFSISGAGRKFFLLFAKAQSPVTSSLGSPIHPIWDRTSQLRLSERILRQVRLCNSPALMPVSCRICMIICACSDSDLGRGQIAHPSTHPAHSPALLGAPRSSSGLLPLSLCCWQQSFKNNKKEPLPF